MAKVKTGYVDGFVLVVPKKNIADYKKMAIMGGKTWMKHGALDYKECVGDDMSPKMVELTFPKLAAAKKNEIVVFSFITFKSRTHRDAVNKKVMKEFEAYADKKMKMPFEMDRMAYGGFTVLVDAAK